MVQFKGEVYLVQNLVLSSYKTNRMFLNVPTPVQKICAEQPAHSMVLNTEKFQHVGEEEIAKGKWVKLSKYMYKDQTGAQREWEVVGRCTKNSEKPDCVSTIALLHRLLKYDCMILVKQYRPPLKAFTLELPAGLIDLEETVEDTALRELKEETGYSSAVVKHVSSVTALDPGLSSCTMKIVTVGVDGDSKENEHAMQTLTSDEFIEVLHVPVDQLLKKLNECSEQGMIIDSRVYSFAIGLAMGKKMAHAGDIPHLQGQETFTLKEAVLDG
ncbi:ADP-sugar pyrophosphatase-like isoform X4 [Tachypleus tridentatus]|uniref:ADP-sugar pyrophosphatase-like isoform X4 n=1 Tax=Tachypleus tridentatus TaxID=6853 RepID=UPI003FD5ADBF